MDKFVNYLPARLQERSTWAGIGLALGSLLMAYGLVDANRWPLWMVLGAAVLAILIPERGTATPLPAAQTDAAAETETKQEPQS